MLLTDSEQKNLLDNFSTVTRQKIKAMRKGFDELIEVSKQDLAEIQELKREIKSRNNRGRGLWQAFCHGFGVTKAEVDKLLKD